MAISLTTWAGQTVTPKDDAIVQDACAGRSGIMYGCGITASGNTLNISAGYGIIKGRLFSVSATAVNITLPSSGTMAGTLYIRLDLANATEPIKFVTTLNSFTPTQDVDANFVNGTYEMPIATFTASTTAITDIEPVYMPIVGIMDAIYPVGSIYMSANNINPSILFGGTWERITGKFLLASDSSHAAGSTGGSANHTITAAELPAHTHSLNNHTHTVPAHTHSASTASAGAHTHNVPRWQQATPTAGGTGRLAQGSIDSSYVTSKAGAHTHSVTVASKPAFNTAAASGSTGSTGSGTPISMMPPYLSVYMWQRTA